MKLSDWLKNTWTHVTIESALSKPVQKGTSTLTVKEINVDLTIGIISTADKEEFSKLVFHLAPVGTIIDEISDEYYEGQLLLTRNYLTKLLMCTVNSKIAEKYLNVLERRDRAHWAKESKENKGLKATATDSDGRTINVTFTTIE